MSVQQNMYLPFLGVVTLNSPKKDEGLPLKQQDLHCTVNFTHGIFTI